MPVLVFAQSGETTSPLKPQIELPPLHQQDADSARPEEKTENSGEQSATKQTLPKPEATGPIKPTSPEAASPVTLSPATPPAVTPPPDTPEFTAFLEQRLATRSVPVKDSIAEKIVIQAMMRILIKRGILPQAVYNLYSKGSNPLVSRASFSNVLVKSQGHDIKLVSEYPTYRDVPKTHWAYAPIEMARERKLLQGNRQGYFQPNEIVSKKDAYLIFAGLLAGTRPPLELTDSILSPFADSGSIPAAIRPDIARLVNAQLILPKPEPNNRLDLEAPLDFAELAAILSREVEIQDYKRFLLPVNEASLPQLPAGASFAIVPNGAIFKNRLAIGDTLYFSVNAETSTTISGQPIQIPRGSRVDGELINIANSAEGQLYQVHLQKIQLPDGSNYQLDGNIDLKFDNKAAEPFIVPGVPYEFTTNVE